MAENYFYSTHSAQEMEDVFDGAVLSNKGQTLSTSQKAQARANIGAGSENTGFQILGYYLTLEEMKESLQVPPQAGDAYGIAVFHLTTDATPEAGVKYYTRSGSGTVEDPYVYTLFSGGSFSPGVDYYVVAYYDTYVFDGTTQDWLDIGPINEGNFIDDNAISQIMTWSSQKIDEVKQDTIDATGVLKGGGNGSVTAATKGTDYGALAFTVTIEAASWSSNVQTVSNANFLASGFAYMVAPASSSFAAYGDASIYADDVTTDGVMTFHCDSAPSVDLTVNIVRMVSA